jgi:valyl-tRNA synthetase
VGDARPELRPRALEERWIAWRLDQTQAQLAEHFAAFDFSPAMNALYHVTFDDFCDWYAEAIKQRLYEGDEDAQATALANLERLLKLLHPAMPHVTEEIWSNLPARETRLIVAPWPEPAGVEDVEVEFEPIRTAAEVFRRAGVRAPLDEEQQRIFDAVVKPERARVDGGNVEAEAERLRGEIERAERMLGNDRFVENAPGDVVEAEREKLERYRRELDALAG